MLPEHRNELSASIGHNRLRQAVQLLDIVSEQSGECLSVTGTLAGYKTAELG